MRHPRELGFRDQVDLFYHNEMNLKSAAIFASALLFTQNLCAETLFEGFYRIERKGKHVGYVMQRLSADTKAGTKTLTTYFRVRQDDQEKFEGTKTVVKVGSGRPISSTYMTTTQGNPVTIVTQYNGAKGKVSFYAGKDKKLERVENIKPVAHASAFIFYHADFKKMVPEKNYEYTALTEERGRIGVGILNYVNTKHTSAGQIVHVVDDFMGQPTESFVSENGEPLGSRAPLEDVIVYWVPNRQEAMGDMQFPTAEMTSLFGDLPEGKKNPWSKLPTFQANSVIGSFAKNPGARAISSEKKVTKRTPMPERKI
jgi:hypothetical protein